MAEDTLMEERTEFMVSPKHPHPKRRLAQFLKPSVPTSLDVQPFLYKPPQFYSPNLSFNFNGWRTPQKDWKPWVDRMHSLHQFTWKKAGIYHAVLNSSYEIIKNDDSIIGLAEKWCHETNSFVFAWGEATITLEDMMVVGGYSVLGESVLHPSEIRESFNFLDEARVELQRSKTNKACQFGWLKKFKDTGTQFEHEAFLVLWLSRFVFPSSYSTVVKHVFPIAIHLARGIRIALAPAVLASLYRDLSFLKAKIDDSINGDYHDEISITVWAPLQLVQIWIWERLPKLMRPVTDGCKPRFSTWDKKKLHIYNAGSLFDCALQNFSWRPYATSTSGIDHLFSSKVYQEKGRWVGVGDGLDEELESWVRCLRASELVGIDGSCIEQYLPHRVAMQFGMDQDIPGEVPRTNASPETAWRFYTRPIRNVLVYLPSKFCEPYVTARYLEWWNKSVGVQARSSPMGDNEKLENFVENESRIEGIKESVDGNKASDESRSEGSKEFVDGTNTLDESITEGSKESADGTKTSGVASLGIHEANTLRLELEARIRKLEEVFAYLKAKKLGQRLM
ncbi:uncharacterized protein LOC112506382 [Cynara cardunculus var. scolymus]|uniref:Aminotransferase-like, plant mobile domain-containing protein n=1 Tax=Cynara cardunculus var. scolymus TaxID=59895 RepID=A0A124SHR6_CYNCS|nr:uncharacterized protein LOC112506382 [Cynara cardunculus var. scolymus]KVI10366.1 Aminotransferase-like, plant mobile domain-containing protein [Cynara cardunculus var. scolymus]